jgi:allantoinase
MPRPIVDRVIHGKRIVLETGLAACAVAVTDGRICGIAENPDSFETDSVLDAGERVVLPGLVDEHAHVWEPGPNNHREDWTTGTMTAASGGITTIIEMAQGVPPAIDVTGLVNKQRIAEQKAVIDFALWGGCVGNAPEDIVGLKAAGCTGFKVFTAWFGPDYASLNDYELFTAMQKIAAAGAFVGVHCENSTLTDGFEKALAAQRNLRGSAHEQARPEIAEIEAISRVLLFARHTGCPVLVLHLSTPNAWPVIGQARRDGVRVWVETCPHYLTMNTSDLDRLHGFAKCAPPIRSEACRVGLWQMVKDGRIDILASDHFPFTDEDRLRHGDDIFAIPSGMPGFDTLLPLLVDEGIHRQGLRWERLAEMTSTNPSKLHGLYPRKGAIRLGADADLVVVDPEERWTYSYRRSYIKAEMRRGPYEGRTFRGRVKHTLVRGETVYVDHEIQQKPGFGRFVVPAGQNRFEQPEWPRTNG